VWIALKYSLNFYLQIALNRIRDIVQRARAKPMSGDEQSS